MCFVTCKWIQKDRKLSGWENSNMQWTSEAEKAIKKVPFFVRKRVRSRVQKEALDEGKNKVTILEVNATRKRFLSKMDSEIKGFQIDSCFSQGSCPNVAFDCQNLQKQIEILFAEEDILGFLRTNVNGKLKFHHEFRVSLADCPNSCSQPQIKDIGIIGAVHPSITEASCSMCEACTDVCKENAINLDAEKQEPEINVDLCLKCAKCIKTCPTGTIDISKKGFRILIGGKLGRHPKLAEELPGLFNENEVMMIIQKCIRFFKENSKNGQRFAEIYETNEFLLLP